MLPTKFRFIWPSAFSGDDFLDNQKQELPVAVMFVNGSEINEQLYRGPSKDASYQILIHLANRFQRRRFFRNQPIRNKNCLWRTCLLMDRDEMSNLYRGPAIDASYQVLLHLDEGFQRKRLKWEKLMDDGRQVMAKAHIAFGKVS